MIRDVKGMKDNGRSFSNPFPENVANDAFFCPIRVRTPDLRII